MWLAKLSSDSVNINVKPSSSLLGVMKFLLPLMMNEPVLIYSPLGGVLDTYSAYTQ
jgi:hypothetical protein